ncbi:hypothetical protein TNCV_480761 [Trichonephila clavipes]|nr:hypothetical protein TNCV_480761 [Trichonephila clavipes]
MGAIATEVDKDPAKQYETPMALIHDSKTALTEGADGRELVLNKSRLDPFICGQLAKPDVLLPQTLRIRILFSTC